MHQTPENTKDGSDSQDVLKVFEESIDVDKLKRVTGRVRVTTTTETVQELAKATLRGESVEFTRLPMDRLITEIPAVRTEGDLTIVPIVEEILVVEKRLRLVEELHIRRHETQESVEMPVTLRKQHAEIDRLPSEKD